MIGDPAVRLVSVGLNSTIRMYLTQVPSSARGHGLGPARLRPNLRESHVPLRESYASHLQNAFRREPNVGHGQPDVLFWSPFLAFDQMLGHPARKVYQDQMAQELHLRREHKHNKLMIESTQNGLAFCGGAAVKDPTRRDLRADNSQPPSI